MSRDPARIGLRFGPHRQLDKIAHHQRRVDRLQGARVHHVLGIVEQYAGIVARAARFITAQRAVQTVKAIGLGGRPSIAQQHQPDPLVSPNPRNRGGQSSGIVAITADVDRQVALRPGRQHVRNRRPDHRAFAIGRDQDRRRPRQGLGPIAHRQASGPRLAAQFQPQPSQVDGKFIQQPDAEPKGREGQQFALNQQQPVDYVPCPCACSDHCVESAPYQRDERSDYPQSIVGAMRSIVRQCRFIGGV